MENFIKIISTINPIITVVISSLISIFIAKYEARNEIKKLLISYCREDKQLLHKAFSELMSTTERACMSPTPIHLNNAISANAQFLAISPKQFHSLLAEMDEALQKVDIKKIKTVRKSLMKLFSNYISNHK